MQPDIPNTHIINLSSDEYTAPTQQMLTLMSQAKVGDDVCEDDQTGNHFQHIIASLFGMQQALFTPTSQMSNIVGVMSWAAKGNQIIINHYSNIIDNCSGSLAVLGGVMTRQLNHQSGIFSLQDVKKVIRSCNDHITFPSTSLIVIQNPTSCGRVWPLATLSEIYQYAHQKNVRVHMDGERIFNALHYYQQQHPNQPITLKTIGSLCDSISVCLDRGLSCPIGGVLLSSKTAINRSRQIRKSLGGGLRQIGVFAAAGLYALQHMVGVLQEDNSIAARIGQMLKQISSIAVDEVHTNIVKFKVTRQDFKGEQLEQYLARHQVIIQPGYLPNQYRVYTYQQIRLPQLQRFIELLREYFA